MAAGAIPDYTYLWWDVRPHPEPRHGRGARLRPADAPRAHDRPRRAGRLPGPPATRPSSTTGRPLVEVPTELIDDNKVRAALRGMDGDADRLPTAEQVPRPRWPRACSTSCASTPRSSAATPSSAIVGDLIDAEHGAHRQLEVLERSGDVKELTVAARRPGLEAHPAEPGRGSSAGRLCSMRARARPS